MVGIPIGSSQRGASAEAGNVMGHFKENVLKGGTPLSKAWSMKFLRRRIRRVLVILCPCLVWLLPELTRCRSVKDGNKTWFVVWNIVGIQVEAPKPKAKAAPAPAAARAGGREQKCWEWTNRNAGMNQQNPRIPVDSWGFLATEVWIRKLDHIHGNFNGHVRTWGFEYGYINADVAMI